MDEKFCLVCTRIRPSLVIQKYDFIDYCDHINCRDYYRGYTLLHDAINISNRQLFDILVSKVPYVDLNADDKDGKTPLLLAVKNRAFDFAMRLMRLGCDVNKKDRKGYTPLMYAVKNGYMLIAHEILKNGADINEQNQFGYTALHYCYWKYSIAITSMFDLLIYYGADPLIRNNKHETFFMTSLRYYANPPQVIVQLQRRAIDFEADMNEINAKGISTLFLAIAYKTPLLEEIIRKGADINYFHEDVNALHLALGVSNRRALDLVLPRQGSRFNYQHVYASYSSEPLLCAFFHNIHFLEFFEDWRYCFDVVCNNSDIIQHAVQHYTFHNYLLPLVSEIVESFVIRDFNESDFFPYVCAVVSYGARVFLNDIEKAYICCGGNNNTVKFLLNMDVELKHTSYYISHPYVMLKITSDINSIFNNHMFGDNDKSLAEQLVFLPTLFKFCTPTHRFMSKLYELYDDIEQEHEDADKFQQDIIAAYEVLIGKLDADMCMVPSLGELSRNTLREEICLRHNIKQYSHYRSLLRNCGIPLFILDILLFIKPVNKIHIVLPRIGIINGSDLEGRRRH